MPRRLFIKDGGLTSSVPTPAGYTVIGANGGIPKKQIISTISDLAGSGNQFQYEIGQYVAAQGGVIAHRWLSTSAGGSPTAGTVQNYLVVDTNDLSSSAPWSISNVNIPSVESTWDGETNTNNLMSAGPGSGIDSTTAAYLCATSSNVGKTDWYLPAIDELNKVWDNRWEIAQGISAASGQQLSFIRYWSSSEVSTSNTWYFNFDGGSTNYTNKLGTYYVRAMRKFSI